MDLASCRLTLPICSGRLQDPWRYSKLLLGGLVSAHLYIPQFSQPEPNAVENITPQFSQPEPSVAKDTIPQFSQPEPNVTVVLASCRLTDCRSLDVSRVHGITRTKLLLGGLGCAHLYIPQFPQPEPNAVEASCQRRYHSRIGSRREALNEEDALVIALDEEEAHDGP